MSDRNRRFLLRERPTDRIGPGTFELNEEAVPEIGDGEALVRVDWISLDPTNRMWINETPTYLPPVGIGEVMRAAGLGEVVASKKIRTMPSVRPCKASSAGRSTRSSRTPRW